MSNLPGHLQLDHADKIVHFFMLKVHLKVHIQTCQIQFSFNFTHWVGYTDGEALECGWANFNHVALSTKEMGPGAH